MFDYFDSSTLASLQEIPNCYFSIQTIGKADDQCIHNEIGSCAKYETFVLRLNLKSEIQIVLSQNVFNFWEWDFFFIMYVKVAQSIATLKR